MAMLFRDSMRITWQLLVALLLGATLLLLTGCSDDGTSNDDAPASTEHQTTSATTTATTVGLVIPESVAAAMAANLTPFTPGQPDTDTIDVNLANAADPAHGIQAENGAVILTRSGSYRLYGTLAGRVVVDCKGGSFTVILDGVSVTSDVPGAFVVTAADEVVLHLAAGSFNMLRDSWDGANLDSNAPNAALHSVADLGITGSGTLTVIGAIDGIASTDGLVIADGTIEVSAGDDALRGKDYLTLSGGVLTLDANGDAMKSTHETDAARGYVWIDGGIITATAGTDCVDATTDMLISGGELRLSCGDDGLHGEVLAIIDGGMVDITRSYEGVEAPVVVVAGGVTRIVSSDDGLNAAGGDGSAAPGTGGRGGRPGGPGGGGPGGLGMDGDPSKYALVISGGTLTIDAGGDGLDSNGSMSISGGDITVYGPTNQGNGALDSSGLSLTGGRLLALGAAGMAEGPAEYTQAWIGAVFSAGAGANITVTDMSNTAFTWSFTILKASGCMVFSVPELVSGATYSIAVNGEVLGSLTAY
ncbi:MAG: carbohydrate-binding domain-containing protein [Propionibacteriaceae bacterium]|jgi:hypothetical protein|nr:carbohydrate-binding domain-containing protein [Propionibacteriaceae bacterium]